MLKKIKLREQIEYEFMPDIIAITEKPDSPLGGFIIWTISILITIALLISIIGKIDTVATASGKLTPKGKLNIITTPDSGVIEKIYVKEGQKVKKGEVLTVFDSEVNNSDLSDIKKQLAINIFEKKLFTDELSFINGVKESIFGAGEVDELTESEKSIYINRHMERKNEYFNKTNLVLLEIEQKKNERQILELSLNNLFRKKTILEKQTNNLVKQQKAGMVSTLEVESSQTDLSILYEEINMQKVKLDNNNKSIIESNQNLILFGNTKKNEVINEIITRNKNIESLETQMTKYSKKSDFNKIVSPVNGTINKISVNNSGGFIKEGQELITIVPEKTILEAEVYISNNDIGFVKVGQNVEIKLDTFPFQDYGSLKGSLRLISPDSEMIEGNLFYKGYVTITKNELKVKKEQKELLPGMSLKAEIQTEKRRIIDFFLSPFKKSLKESLNVR